MIISSSPPSMDISESTIQPKHKPVVSNQSLIPMPRMRRLNASEVEAILKRYGFELVPRQGKGSHRKLRNLSSNLQVTFPYHDRIKSEDVLYQLALYVV